MKLKSILFAVLIGGLIFLSSPIIGQTSDESLDIDSIAYSKDDAFFGYTVYDVFLTESGKLYKHELDDIVQMYPGGRKTQLGKLQKTKVKKAVFQDLKSVLEDIGVIDLENSYQVTKSDQTTAYLALYNDGNLVKSIEDYGMQGNAQLQTIYKSLDELQQLDGWRDWDSESIDLNLLDQKPIDSIRVIQHLKSEGKYYRNGVKKSTTLINEDLSSFLRQAIGFQKCNPYKHSKYEIMTGRTEKYSMVVFYQNGKQEWINYNGRRFMKKTYLNFQTSGNVFRSYL